MAVGVREEGQVDAPLEKSPSFRGVREEQSVFAVKRGRATRRQRLGELLSYG
jgi:hypothetical protein